MEPVAFDRAARGKNERGCAVVDAGCIAGRHRADGAEWRRQAGKLFDGRLARVFVVLDARRLALAPLDRIRGDFASETPALLCRRRAGLAAQRKAVLVFARDGKLGRDVFGGLRHGVDAVLGFHDWIDEAPAYRRVMDFGAALERALGLGHDEGRARHAFDAAGDDNLGFTQPDRAGGVADGVQPGTAKPVDRRSGYRFGQPREQGSHARDVAVVFACLVGAAKNNLIDRLSRNGRNARQRLADHVGRKIVRARARQRAAIATDGRADAADDIGFTHGICPCLARL
ncbi:hypothetical protein D9M68_393180 [compost metagenome]